jgi:sporulation integral membrane protein YtvI
MIWLAVLGAGILLLIPYSIPLILALITAMLLEPIVQLLIRNMKVNRLAAVSISFLLFLALFAIGGYLAGAQLVVQSIELAQKLPALSSTLFEAGEKYLLQLQNYYASLPAETVSAIQQVFAALRQWAANAAKGLAAGILGIAAGLPGFLLVSVVYLISLFLISLDLPRLRVGFMNLFTPSAREKVELVIDELSRATIGFLRAQVIMSLMTYIIAFIGLLILGVKYAALLSLLIVIVDILPILGTGTFIVPWAAYSFITGNVRLAVGLLILFAVITVVRRIVEPKILGSTLGISALAALVSLYLGFKIMGVFGLILGPAIVIVFEALRKAGFLKIKIDF